MASTMDNSCWMKHSISVIWTAFGKVDAPLHAYQEAYSVMRALGRDIERMQMDDAERSRRIDTLEREIEEWSGQN